MAVSRFVLVAVAAADRAASDAIRRVVGSELVGVVALTDGPDEDTVASALFLGLHGHGLTEDPAGSMMPVGNGS